MAGNMLMAGEFGPGNTHLSSHLVTIDDLLIQIEQNKLAMEKWENECQRFEVIRTELLKELTERDKLNVEISQLSSENAFLSGEVDDLKLEVDTYRDMKLENDEMKKENKSMKSRIQTLKSTCDMLSKIISDSQGNSQKARQLSNSEASSVYKAKIDSPSKNTINAMDPDPKHSMQRNSKNIAKAGAAAAAVAAAAAAAVAGATAVVTAPGVAGAAAVAAASAAAAAAANAATSKNPVGNKTPPASKDQTQNDVINSTSNAATEPESINDKILHYFQQKPVSVSKPIVPMSPNAGPPPPPPPPSGGPPPPPPPPGIKSKNDVSTKQEIKMPKPMNFSNDKFDVHFDKDYVKNMKSYLAQFKDVSANSTPPVNPSNNIMQLGDNNLFKKKPELIKDQIRCLLFNNVIRLMAILIISVPYDKESDKDGKNATDIYDFIERKTSIIENFDDLLKSIFPQQKYKSTHKNISKDDCVTQQKDLMEKFKDNLQFTSEDIKSNISKYFSNIITKFGNDDKSETKENIDRIIDEIYNIYETNTETVQKDIIQDIFEKFKFKTDENLDKDLITVLDQIDCYPTILYEGITGFNQFNSRNQESYNSKMKEFESESYDTNIDKILNYLKEKMQEITNEEKNKRGEKSQIESTFNSVSITTFELNENYLLLFKILKLNLFTLITNACIGKLTENYTIEQYDDYFNSQQKQFNWTEIASNEIKKTLFLVNIKNNVCDAILRMINCSDEPNFQGVNKEFDTVLRTCVEKLKDFVIKNNLGNNSEVVESLNEYKKRQNDLSTKATGFPMDLILYSDTPPCASAVPTVFRVCSFLT